ncbi:UDP-N-acetylmuramate--L-alanine ligase [candidate division KSB1 bacterium]|nr:UDP-N-acetylmuramate--L-alanine ligase [candidate division KSB1 bacterium]
MTNQRPFRRIKHVHMIGIGGAGMCGIAEVLLNRGFTVSGSDLQLSAVTERLQGLGARIHAAHQAEQIIGADVIVYSSAVRPENVELRAARDARIPTIPRSEMLAELMRMKTGIAVAGTHGKTTTTSMVGAILQHAGWNPTLIVGGIVRAIDSGARIGIGDYMVVEADEFDRSFLKLSPTLAVITTIEAEHLDTYGDLEGVKDAFVEFASRVPFYGTVIVYGDDAEVKSVLPRIKRPTLTYGFSEASELRGMDLAFLGTHSRCRVLSNRLAESTLELQVPGRHNVLNALAALATADELEIPRAIACEGLAGFTGVRRRFEVKGEFSGVIIVDDYAHHPTEVENVLRTARLSWPDRRLVALFQPHLFTRTRDFFDEFGRVLALADRVLLTEIYGAREQSMVGITSELIADSARAHGASSVEILATPDITRSALARIKRGDVVLVMGAGNITRVSEELSQALS